MIIRSLVVQACKSVLNTNARYPIGVTYTSPRDRVRLMII